LVHDFLNSIAFGVAVFEGVITIEIRRQLRLKHLMDLFIDQGQSHVHKA